MGGVIPSQKPIWKMNMNDHYHFIVPISLAQVITSAPDLISKSMPPDAHLNPPKFGTDAKGAMGAFLG